MPAPTMSTSTARSALSGENRGAGVLSVQYEFVSARVMNSTAMQPRCHADGVRAPHERIGMLQVLLHVSFQRTDCFTAVADGQLLLRGDLAECLAVGRVIKDRVVAQSARARGLLCQLPLDNTFCFEHDLTTRGERERADESCGA